MKTFMETINPQRDPAAKALWEVYVSLLNDHRIPYDVVQMVKDKLEGLEAAQPGN